MDDLYWHQILWPDQSLRQTVKALAKSMQIYWKSYAFLGGLENNESSRLPSAQLFQQIIVQHHFNHAPVRQTAAEPGIFVGSLDHNDRQPDIGAIFRQCALHKCALFLLGARWGITPYLPVAVHNSSNTGSPLPAS
jgi:hypothetical protein